MELQTPFPLFFLEYVKIWYENKDIESKIEVKDILRQPPHPPPIRILMFLESCLYFFCLSRFFYESALSPSHFQKRSYVPALKRQNPNP